MMYIVREAEQSYKYDLYFVAIIILGAFGILNLLLAT